MATCQGSWRDGGILITTFDLIRPLIISHQLNIISSGWKQKDLSVTNPMKEFTYPGLFMSRVCHRREAWFCEAVVVHREQAATKQMW